MKKFSYMVGAFILGVAVASSAGTVSAQVKSLIGQKVTGEYTVVVNGKELADKGAVIDGKTNGPIRAISDAIGGSLIVDNKKKVINITTGDQTSHVDQNTDTNGGTISSNKYIGEPKASLLNSKDVLENKILKPTIEGRKEILADIEILKTSGMNGEPAPGLAAKEKQLSDYDADIAKYTKELEQVEEALKLLEK